MEDSQIVQLYLDRDQRAIEETDCLYGKRLSLLAMGILKEKEDSKESVNDTYLKAWQSIPPQIPQFFFAYLSKICRYTCFEKLKYKNAQKRKAEVLTLSEELENCVPSLDQTVEYMELGELISKFLKSQGEESRLIFVRRYFFSDSIDEIAKRYKMGQSKIKTSLFRTRNSLKLFLEKEGVTL